MYWSKSNTYNPTMFEEDEYSVWDEEGLLKFSHNCSFYLSGSDNHLEATYKDTPLIVDQPF
jgi:hypothetical protein